MEERKKELGRKKEWRTPKEQGLLNASANSYELTRLKQSAQGLHGPAPGPLDRYHSFPFNTFMGLLNMVTRVALILVTFLCDLIVLFTSLVHF